MSIEADIQRQIFSSNSEKTFIDKLLARNDVDHIRTLIKKQNLTRSEMLEILYMLISTESKLQNYSEWDRYVILKYFVWVREFVKLAELLFDYQDHLEHRNIQISPRTKRMFKNIMLLMEHNVKFLADLYLNIGRTSLSVGATAFIEMLKNKYEVDYKNMPQMQQPQQTGGFLGRFRK